MNLEGEIRIALRCAGSEFRGVDLHSTRPDLARQLLQGRTRAEVEAAVPRLFALCARSQSAAARLACAAAAGLPEADLDAQVAALSPGVQAETLREIAWSCLLQWPQQLGCAPDAEARAAARQLHAATAAPAPSAPAASPGTASDDGSAPAPWRSAVAQAVLGEPAVRFLQRLQPPDASGDDASLRQWAEAGRTVAARVLHAALQEPRGADAPPLPPLLPATWRAAGLRTLAQSLRARADFAQRPTWQGQPAETGSVARQQHLPVLAAMLGDDRPATASRRAARLSARLLELARLLCEQPLSATPPMGALCLGGGEGLAWVENARGLLLHVVRVEGPEAAAPVRAYGIVAPTEWNFHPDGAMAQALAQASWLAPSADPEALRNWTERLIHSLDPCVACRVEITDA